MRLPNMKNSGMFGVFFLLLFFDGSTSFNLVDPCEENQNPGNWTCVENQNGILNLTYDCNFNTNKSLNLWLWSDKFPPKMMKALTIKNCYQVIFGNNLKGRDPRIYFSDLQIVNVSYLTLDNEYTDDKNMDNFLPANTLFKDIKLMKVKSTLLSGSKYRDLNIDSLKFINLTLVPSYSFDIISGEHSSSLKELTMENVAFPEKYFRAFYLFDKTATVKIINSTFSQPLVEKCFNGSVGKLIVTGSTFKEISKGAFVCNVDEFVFSGNKVEIIRDADSQSADDKNWSIQSPVVKIEGNTFDYVGNYGFYGIGLASSGAGPRIFNFSKNRIRAMTPTALEFEYQETYSSLKDVFIVTENKIDCSCQNIDWFQRMALVKNGSYSLWIHTENRNRCFGIGYCTLNQVFDNFLELCNDDYECPANFPEDTEKLCKGEMALLIIIPSCMVALLIVTLIYLGCTKNEGLINCALLRYTRLESEPSPSPSSSPDHNSVGTE